MINRETLERGDEQHTIWQTDKESGVAEPALQITEYRGSNILTIRQDKNEINVNLDTLPELIKVLKHYRSKGK